MQSNPILLDKDLSERFEKLRELAAKKIVEKYKLKSIDEFDEDKFNEDLAKLNEYFTEDEKKIYTELCKEVINWVKGGATEDYFEFIIDNARAILNLRNKVSSIDSSDFSEERKELFETLMN